MTERTKTILAFGVGFAIIGVTAILIIRRRRNVGRTPFRRRAVKIAKKEFAIWNEGKRKETDSKAYSDLKRYWDNLNWSENQWSPSGVAWSSAFISYVMDKARAKDDFTYASSHADYIRDAIKNRKENNNNKFKGYKLNEKKVEIGDLVCYARENGVDYDTTRYYQSHCDIVTEIDDNYAYGIGGNVSDSVSKSKIPIKDGYVQSGNRRFVVIKTK
jgi:hypothetical protein